MQTAGRCDTILVREDLLELEIEEKVPKERKKTATQVCA